MCGFFIIYTGELAGEIILMHVNYTKINRCVLFLFCIVTNLSLIARQREQIGELTSESLYQEARARYKTEPLEAINFADEAANQAIGEKNIRVVGKAYFLMGYVYKNMGDIPNAFHYYFGAMRAYRKIGDRMRVQQLYGNLAFIAEAKGVHTIAEQLRRDRLKLEGDVNYQVWSDMHYDLAISLKHQGEIEEAFNHHLKALNNLERNPDLLDTAMYANIWLEMGVLNYMQAMAIPEPAYFDSALLCYDRSIHFNGGDAIHLSKLKNNMGNVLRIQGQHESAKQLFHESIRLSEDWDKRKISPYFNLGRIYYAENQVDSAIWAFTRSLEINIDEVSYREAQDLSQLNIELSKAPELFGAVQYLDSLGIRDLEIRGRAMRHVYHMARERYEIINASNNSMIAQLYEKHREELAEEARWSFIKTWVLSVSLAFAAMMAFWFWWRRFTVRRHNRRLAAQMEKRLKEKYGIELKD